jgi:UDP-N-acetylmuramoyl-tripeptide--D-alanyl-D-alanine ligase
VTVAGDPRLDLDMLAHVSRTRLGEPLSLDPGVARTVSPATGVAFHHDHLRRGSVFFALAGAHTHGIAFADDALARGAAFVVSDRPHPRGILVRDPAALLLALGHEARAAWRGPVIGVSGSVGKTTLRALLAAALAAPSSTGNRNTPYALATTLVAHWLAGDTGKPLVLELGIDHAGEMDRLTDLVRPTHAVLTTIAPAHLDGLGDLAGVAHEKSRLLEAASARRYAGAGAWRALRPALRDVTLRYGLVGDDAPTAAEDAPDTDATPTGRYLVQVDRPRLIAHLAPGEAPVEVGLPGPGSALAEHALGALVIARELGVSALVAADRIAAAVLEPRRLQVRRLGALTLIDDSYNANPASMALALDVLRSFPAPRSAVLGDMRELGDEAEAHHAALAAACGGLEPLWAVGPLGRVLVADHPGASHYADVAAAIEDVDRLPQRGTLLVKGSRSIALDRLVDALVARREVAS